MYGMWEFDRHRHVFTPKIICELSHVPEVLFGSNADRSLESSEMAMKAESHGALMGDPAISLEGIAKILTNLYHRVKSLKYSYSNNHSKPTDSKINVGGVNQENIISSTIVHTSEIAILNFK